MKWPHGCDTPVTPTPKLTGLASARATGRQVKHPNQLGLAKRFNLPHFRIGGGGGEPSFSFLGCSPIGNPRSGDRADSAGAIIHEFFYRRNRHFQVHIHSQRWSPSFGQVSGQIKVKSGFISQAASGCDEAGQGPGLRATPTVYALAGVRFPSDTPSREVTGPAPCRAVTGQSERLFSLSRPAPVDLQCRPGKIASSLPGCP